MPHRLGAVFIGALMLVALVSPVAAANELTNRGPVTLSGELMHVHGDTMDGDTHHHEWRLVKEDNESVELLLPVAAADDQVGKTVEVNGTMHGRKLAVRGGGMRVTGGRPHRPAAPTAAAGGTGTGGVQTLGTTQALTTKRLAVLLINFTGNTGQPFTTQQTSDAFFGASPAYSVNTLYQEQSYGTWSVSGDVFGYYTVNGNLSTCDWSTWGSLARTAATNAGVNLNNYTNVVHVFVGQGTCGWSGLAYLPGNWSFLNGNISTYVASHELGHNFGAHHASTTYCTDGGVRVAIGTSCSYSEYGDPFDVMGGAARLSSTWHRKQEGQLTTADQVTVTGSGTYSVGVAESASPAAPRIVRIVRGDGTYLYLEYRQPAGVFDNYAADAPPTNGILIRIAPDSALVQTKLVDATPLTSTYADASLGVGQTIWDPVGGITIQTVSVDADSAVVQVTIRSDDVPPSAVGSLAAAVLSPTSARLSWTAATDNVKTTGYRISRAGMSDVSVSGSPWTDTAVPAGADATWTVSARDAAGNWGPPTDVTLTMPAPDTAPPTAVGSLTATALTSTSARLSWTAAGDDFGVTGYRISRAGRSDVNVSAGPWTDTALAAGGTYTWTVLAFDAAGNLGPTTSVSVTMPAGDVAAPTAPTNFTVTNSRAGRAALKWGISTDNVKVTGYRVYRDGVLIKTVTKLSLNDTVAAGLHYWYVKAIDAAGNASLSSNVITMTTR
jgi:hypothetical protein